MDPPPARCSASRRRRLQRQRKRAAATAATATGVGADVLAVEPQSAAATAPVTPASAAATPPPATARGRNRRRPRRRGRAADEAPAASPSNCSSISPIAMTMRDFDWFAAMKEAKREGDLAPDLPEMGDQYPDWIMLARDAFISDCKNATVAHGVTSDGNPIQVSLFAAEPPAVSHLRVHCPGREDKFSYNPVVIFSRDGLILFDVCFGRDGVSDYFIYRADPKEPSLVRIPDPEPYTSSFRNTGIVRYGVKDFAIAALYWDQGVFKLTVFSTSTSTWNTRIAPVEPSEWVTKKQLNVLGFSPNKVIPLKGSLLGWVDLWGGIMVCDIRSVHPVLQYIPMPEPLRGNIEHKGEPAYFRDVIGCGQEIKFVEVEYHDEDDDEDDDADYKWVAVTRSRTLDSMGWGRELDSMGWGRAHEFSSEYVTVSEDFQGSSDLLPELCVNGKPSLKKMPIGLPTLCEFSNVMYFMCKAVFWDSKGWVIAVDPKSKKMESVARFSAPIFLGFMPAYYPSSFSKFLNDNNAASELEYPPVSDSAE